MDPLTVGLLAGQVAAPIIGGIMGNAAAAGDRAAQRENMQKAVDAIRSVMPPDPESQKVFFEHLRQQGVLTPELEQAVTLGPSAMQSVSIDPAYRAAQMDALRGLSQEAAQNGMGIQDQAALDQAEQQTAQINRGNQQAIMTNAKARGVGGSGMELAQRLQSAQGSAQANQLAGVNAAADARTRALQALAQSGTMAGQMESQDFQQKAAKAQAADAIARFNAQNLQSVNNANTYARNQAQAFNLGEAQRVADTNVNLDNQQTLHNTGVYQTDFRNREGQARDVANAYTGQGGYYGQQGDRTANQYAAGGQAVSEAINGYQKNQALADYLNKKYGSQPGQTSVNTAGSDTNDTYNIA